MATVYLAQDLKHHRRVAIKVLKPELATLGPDRFLREIDVTAGLNHPHIVPLYDSGEVPAGDGPSLVFFVMPYVEGESLRERLRREKQLAIDAAISIVREVAGALTYAHNRGVVHRDIKPENILLVEGHAVVADFGIAHAVAEAGAARLTQTGLALGTPSYMSPEQVTGDRDVDGRTDVYALGCVLYEMLAGEPPYTGGTVRAVLAGHLTEPPPPVRRVRDLVPEQVETAITRALAKLKADRYSTPQAFADALVGPPTSTPTQADRVTSHPADARSIIWRRTATRLGLAVAATLLFAIGFNVGGFRDLIARGGADTPANTDRQSVAVLPFENIGGNAAEEYFSDGLTEELITALSQIRSMRVAARTSAFQFKGRSGDIREVGRTLNVASVLVGSVRKADQRVRVTAQLIDASTGLGIWSQTYEERALADIFDIQADLAVRIAHALEASLTASERQRITRKPTANLQAYTLYLKGRQAWHQRGEALYRAIDYFNQAIAADSQYAQAYAGLASTYAPLGVLGYIHPREGRARMRDAAYRAVALDDELAEAHTVLAAYLHVYEWEWEAAEREYRRAIALDPSFASAYVWYWFLLNGAGRFDEALTAGRRAAELDPLAPIGGAGVTLRLLGRYEEAVSEARAATELHPSVALLQESLGRALLATGKVEEAIRTLERAIALAGRSQNSKAHLAIALARVGRENEARRLIAELRANAAATDIYRPVVAGALAAVEGNDAAIKWLEASYRQRHPDLVTINVETTYAQLRSDPRFQDLVRRIGLQPSGAGPAGPPASR